MRLVCRGARGGTTMGGMKIVAPEEGGGTSPPTREESYTALLLGNVESTAAVPKKALSAIAIAFTCYSMVSGGPVGVEGGVGAGGGFASIMVLLAISLFWALPQSLMTAELSTALPTNGGNIDWVIAGLGWIPGVCNSISLLCNLLLDLPLYPGLLVASLSQIVDLSSVASVAIKLAVLAIALVLNCFGLDAVSSAASLLTIFIMLPFLALPIVAAASHSTFVPSAMLPAATPPNFTANWSVFLSALLWNMQGWTGVGNMAAEVHNPQKVYPRGVMLAVVLVTASYAFSIICGVMLHPDMSDWEEGYFVQIARDVRNWLGVWTAVAASISSMSTFISSLASYARSLQAIAIARIIPIPWLGRNMTKYEQPIPALIVMSVSTIALMFVNLEKLMVFDTCFSNISIILTTIAFLRLRKTHPNLLRPYSVPYGWVGAWMLSVPIFVFGAFTFYAQGSSTSDSGDVEWYSAVAPILLNLVLVVGLYVWKWAGCERRMVHAAAARGYKLTAPSTPGAELSLYTGHDDGTPLYSDEAELRTPFFLNPDASAAYS
ncbi:APC family permease [archaeon]|nr:MAG: APC family permease [archaeon]